MWQTHAEFIETSKYAQPKHKTNAENNAALILLKRPACGVNAEKKKRCDYSFKRILK